MKNVSTESVNLFDNNNNREIALRNLVAKGIVAKLDKKEHTRDNILGIKGALRAASISLAKNIPQDEIISKVEELIFSKSELHKACYGDCVSFLKEVKLKGGYYTKWTPRTLQILDNKPKEPVFKKIQPIPVLNYKTLGEINLINFNDNLITKKDSKVSQVLEDIRVLNQTNPSIIKLASQNGLLEQYYENVQAAGYKDSIVFRQGLPIHKWTKEDISKWSKAIKSHPEIGNNIKMLPEMLAVISRAVDIKTGYTPRPVQLLSVLIMNIDDSDKGKLLQIHTGEGKSTTTAIAATVNALKGRKVDIVTSSLVLAKRDALEWQDFYNIFNITSSHNIIETYVNGSKDCYAKDIVYGDSLHFQSDVLRHEYHLLGTRGSRKFADSVVLIDEVDSMLIDESGKIAKLATPVSGMEYLAPIFVAAAHYLKQIVGYFQTEVEGDLGQHTDWIEKNLSQYIKKMVGLGKNLDGVEQLLVPPHLISFVEEQADVWASSAIKSLSMTEKRDYLIIEYGGRKVIAPVDYAGTGVVQERTNWMNGLHQFLQIKHNLAMSAESLTSCFMSNLSYFRRYGGNIFGMSGTLGSSREQELLKTVYKVDLAFIPTFKPSKFIELPGIVAASEKEWYQEIVTSTKELTNNKRAVLILAETIDDVEKIVKALEESNINPQKIRTYTTGSNTETEQVLEQKAMTGDIIVATNLAGRGTDVKTSKAVEVAGGLHVCLTFLPSNLRVEEQAFGRTARQGNNGSGQLIINGSYEALKLFETTIEEKDTISTSEIDLLKLRRDKVEILRINDIEKRLLPKIELEDKLFASFSELSHKMKLHQDNGYKLKQLEEHWGLWFKKISNKLDKESKSGQIDHQEIVEQFNLFKSQMQPRYQDGHSIIQNQVHLTGEAINKLGKNNSYNESIDLLSKALELSGDYGFAVNYNLAYAYFRKNGENLKKNNEGFVENGIKHLNKALMQLEGVVIPQLHMSQILIGEEGKNSDLSIQIATKLNLHQLQSEYIKNALNKIDEGLSREKVVVIDNSNTKPVFEVLGQHPSRISDEVLEFLRFGNVQLFSLEAKSPPKDTWGAIGMGLLGAAQFVVGALVTVCTGGGAIALGATMLLSGAQDLYKTTRVIFGKEKINWQDYWLNKGISYAVSIIAMGWENFKNGISAIKEQVGRITEAGKNFFNNTAGTIMGKQAVGQIATSSTTFTSIAKEFIAKKGMSVVAMEIGKSIAVQNVTNFVAKKISNSLTSTKEDVREDAYNRIMQTLTTEPTATSINRLIAMDRICGNNHYSLQIKKVTNELLAPKIDKITQIAKQLSTAAVMGMASRSNNPYASIGMKVVSTGVELAQAANEMKELLGEFCQELAFKIAEVEKSAMLTMPSIIHERLAGRFLDKKDINSIIEILKMNQILPSENMQFNNELLVPSSVFVGGLGSEISSNSELKKFQFEDLKQGKKPTGKNIEEVDFGLYRKHREAIIKVARDIGKLQAQDYSAERHQLAQGLAGKVTDRTMGIIRHSIIAPVMMPAVSFSTEVLGKHLLEFASKGKISGVSGGDDVREIWPDDDKGKEEMDEGEKVSVREVKDLRNEKEEIYFKVKKTEEGNLVERNYLQAPYEPELGKDFLGEEYLVPPMLNKDFWGGVGEKLQKIFTTEEHREVGIVGGSNKEQTLVMPIKPRNAYVSLSGVAAIPNFELPLGEISLGNYLSQIAPSLLELGSTITPALPLVGLGLEYGAGNRYKQNLTQWSNIASNSVLEAKPTAVDYTVANSRGIFDPENPYDLQALQYVARGVAIERSGITHNKDNSLNRKVSNVLSGISSVNNDDVFGICKESHPYLLEDDRFKIKQDWMHKPNVSFKDKRLLEGVQLYGLNPNEVGIGKKGGLKINTELPGGEIAARECFKNLTGVEVPLILFDGKERFNRTNGDVIMLRTPEQSKSGHWKVEIHTTTQHEKITFKDL